MMAAGRFIRRLGAPAQTTATAHLARQFRALSSEPLTIPTDREQQAGRRKEELDAEAGGEVAFNRDPIVPSSDAGTKANPILVRAFGAGGAGRVEAFLGQPLATVARPSSPNSLSPLRELNTFLSFFFAPPIRSPAALTPVWWDTKTPFRISWFGLT